MASHRTVEYKDDAGNLFEGVVFTPKNANPSHLLPGVMVIPAFRGITKHEMGTSEKLANELNVIVLVADFYGKGIRPHDPQEAFKLLMPLAGEKRQSDLKPRLSAGLETLKNTPGVDKKKIGAMGYCIGGTCVMDMARYAFDFKAGVSFHGNFKPVPDLPLTPLSASLSIHHGDADVHITKESVDAFFEEMRTRKADFAFTSYANAEHGFTEIDAAELNRPGVSYNEKADKRSWSAMIAFFKEHLF